MSRVCDKLVEELLVSRVCDKLVEALLVSRVCDKPAEALLVSRVCERQTGRGNIDSMLTKTRHWPSSGRQTPRGEKEESLLSLSVFHTDPPPPHTHTPVSYTHLTLPTSVYV